MMSANVSPFFETRMHTCAPVCARTHTRTHTTLSPTDNAACRHPFRGRPQTNRETQISQREVGLITVDFLEEGGFLSLLASEIH